MILPVIDQHPVFGMQQYSQSLNATKNWGKLRKKIGKNTSENFTNHFYPTQFTHL